MSGERECQHPGDRKIGVQYAYPHPEMYDGVSEWVCGDCGRRVGRWSGRVLIGEDYELRYGRSFSPQAGEQS